MQHSESVKKFPESETPSIPRVFAERNIKGSRILIASLIVNVFLVYHFSNPKPQSHFDYTYSVAENISHGRIAFKNQPPS